MTFGDNAGSVADSFGKDIEELQNIIKELEKKTKI